MKTSSLTPICDFVTRYRDRGGVRMHMPGHKGHGRPEVEGLDITEIAGADSLYDATGIIRRSEEIASLQWGAHTFYVTEGSSQAIRAMVHLAVWQAGREGKRPLILACRNAHKAFVSAVGHTDCDVAWIWSDNYLSCPTEAQALDAQLAASGATAVYVTSPDYLGNRLDIAALSDVCHRHGALLLVDNAHGAYLKWISPSLHPMDLGADMCCDSAHKTLPALTGCAYLHIAYGAPEEMVSDAKNALALYGSTSPSYLLLTSLDSLNGKSKVLAKDIRAAATHASSLKRALACKGFDLVGDEPCKITIASKTYGYTGDELAAYLEEHNIYPEFCDPDHLVLMPSALTKVREWNKLQDALLSLPLKAPIAALPPKMGRPQVAMRIREALMAPAETVPVGQAEGRVLAAVTVGCPPAVPIAVSGEVIDHSCLEAFAYYGIKTVKVVK